MRKLLLVVVLAFAAFGGVAQAGTVSLTPVTPYLIPNFDGAGDDQWDSQLQWSDNASGETYQIEVRPYIYSSNCACDSANALQDQTYTMSGSQGPALFSAEFVGPFYGGCPFPGSQWFGSQVNWRSRVFVAGLGQWTSWTAFKWSPVSAGWFGNGCP